MAACWQLAPRTAPPVAAVSTPALAAWLASELDETLLGVAPVGGGCIHSSWCLRLASGRQLFAKTNSAERLPLLQAEVEGLRVLAAWAEPPLRLPQPLALTTLEGQALLLLSWLDLAHGSGAGAGWRQLGESLARLHRASAGGNGGRGYGLDHDNFIGLAPQRNGWTPDWAEFFRSERLEPQLAWAAAAGQALTGAERLLALLPEWLNGHGPMPVLVHGDLWSGNAALLRGGDGALFDPSCHWADREVDLAMAELFGGFPPAFFAGYEAQWPLPQGYRERRPIYNLYHLLNHANLFGGGYWRRAQQCISSVLRMTPPR
ncbi:MAG: fructosamine kinase family protein [Cyanobium sp. M30B3]|nr:MAG: fructosamine kinase family protein [Cyanobium sp. M30B3]